jgi:hypothetical protein
LDAARTSMGTDISDFDMQNIVSFAKRVVALDDYRKVLHEYLGKKVTNPSFIIIIFIYLVFFLYTDAYFR